MQGLHSALDGLGLDSVSLGPEDGPVAMVIDMPPHGPPQHSKRISGERNDCSQGEWPHSTEWSQD